MYYIVAIYTSTARYCCILACSIQLYIMHCTEVFILIKLNCYSGIAKSIIFAKYM